MMLNDLSYAIGPFWFGSNQSILHYNLFSLFSIVLLFLSAYFAYLFFQHKNEKQSKKWLFLTVLFGSLFFVFPGFGLGLGFGFIGLMMALGMLFMLLFWGSVIWIFIWVMQSLMGVNDSLNALEILKKRYAKGEVSKREFEVMKRELR